MAQELREKYPFLYPYQAQGAAFLILARQGLLADEMGLGKTVQSLVAANERADRILVLCPSFLVHKWRNEATRWLELRPSQVVLFGEEIGNEAKVAVVGYGALSSIKRGKTGKKDLLKEIALRFRGAVVILDEVHEGENP